MSDSTKIFIKANESLRQQLAVAQERAEAMIPIVKYCWTILQRIYDGDKLHWNWLPKWDEEFFDKQKEIEELLAQRDNDRKHNPDCVSLVPVLNKFRCNCGLEGKQSKKTDIETLDTGMTEDEKGWIG